MNIQINDNGLIFMKSKQHKRIYYDEDLGEYENETLSMESHCNCSLHNKRATSPKFEYEVIKEEFYDTDKERATPTEVYKHNEINEHDSLKIDYKKIECLNIENTSSEEDNDTDNSSFIAEKEVLFNFKEFLKENHKSTLNKKSKKTKLSTKIASENSSRELKQLDVEINTEVKEKELQVTENLISLKKNKTRSSSSIEEVKALNELLNANVNNADKTADVISLDESLRNLENGESSKDNDNGRKRKSKEPSNRRRNLSDIFYNDNNISSNTKSKNDNNNYEGRKTSTKYNKMINQKFREDSEKDSQNLYKKNETVELGISLEMLNNVDDAITTYHTHAIETKCSLNENIGCTRSKREAKKRRRNKENKIVEYLDEMNRFSDENDTNKHNHLSQITKNGDEVKSSKTKRKELANNKKTTETDDKPEYCNSEKHLYTSSIEGDEISSKSSEKRSKTSRKRKKDLAESATEDSFETPSLSKEHFDNQLVPTRTVKKKHKTVEETDLEEGLPNVQDNFKDVSLTNIDKSKTSKKSRNKCLHILDIPVETSSKKHTSRESRTNLEMDISSQQKNSDIKENNKPTSSVTLKDNDSNYDCNPIAKSLKEIHKTVTSENLIPDKHATPIVASNQKHKTTEQKAQTNEVSYNLPNEINTSSSEIDVIGWHFLDNLTTSNNKQKNIELTINAHKYILNQRDKNNSEIPKENNIVIHGDSSNDDDVDDVEKPNTIFDKQLETWKPKTNSENDSSNPNDNSDTKTKKSLTCDSSKADNCNNSEISYQKNNEPVSCESSILDNYNDENPIVAFNEKHENRNLKTKYNSTNSQDMSLIEMDKSKTSDVSNQKLFYMIDSPIRTYSRKHKSKIPKTHSKNDNSNPKHNSEVSSVENNNFIPRHSSNDDDFNKNDNPIKVNSSNKQENEKAATNLEKDISNLNNSDISSKENSKQLVCESSAVGYINNGDNPNEISKNKDECREPKTSLLRAVSDPQHNLLFYEENNIIISCNNSIENYSNNGDQGTTDIYLSTIRKSVTSDSSRKDDSDSNFPIATLNERHNITESKTISNEKSSNVLNISSPEIDKSDTSNIFNQKLFQIFDSPLRTYRNKYNSRDSHLAKKSLDLSSTPIEKSKSPKMPEKKLFPLFKCSKATSRKRNSKDKSKGKNSDLREIPEVPSQEINETIACFSSIKGISKSDDNVTSTSNNKQKRSGPIKHSGKDNIVENPTAAADEKYDKGNTDISSTNSIKTMIAFSLGKDDSEMDKREAISDKEHESKESKNTDSSNSKDDSGILITKIDETKSLIKGVVDISDSPAITSNIKLKSGQPKIKPVKENSNPQESSDVSFKGNNKIKYFDSPRKEDNINKSSKSRKQELKKVFLKQHIKVSSKRKPKQLGINKSKSLKFPKTDNRNLKNFILENSQENVVKVRSVGKFRKTNKWNLKNFVLEKSQNKLVNTRSKEKFPKSNKWNLINFLLETSQENVVKARSKSLEFREIIQINSTDNVTEITDSQNSFNETSNSIDTTKYEKEDSLRKVFPCGTCNEEFTSRVLLLKHYNKAHSTDIRCKFCGKTYSKIGNLDRHQNTACENNTNKIRETKPPKVFNCHQCNKFYMRRKELLEHIKILHKDEIKCRYCNKNITRRTNLKRHLIYVCKMNGIVRENNKKLKYGMYANQFICDYCDKTYTLKKSLISHIKSHMNLKEYYNCSHCDKRYTKRYNLKCHIEGAHMNRKMFTCNYCNIQFTFKWSLLKHEQAHSEGTTRLIPTAKNSAKNNKQENNNARA